MASSDDSDPASAAPGAPGRLVGRGVDSDSGRVPWGDPGRGLTGADSLGWQPAPLPMGHPEQAQTLQDTSLSRSFSGH